MRTTQAPQRTLSDLEPPLWSSWSQTGPGDSISLLS